MKYSIALLLLAMCATSFAGLYSIRPITEDELCRLYVQMLMNHSRYAETKWHDGPFPNSGYWGNGMSGSNEGIRAVGNVSLAFATLLKQTNALDDDTRRLYADHAVKGIRYAAQTHITGTQKCIDGKQWGNSWQSAMWAGNMGFAAWLLWDDLDPGLKESVEKVVAHEADRFLGNKPPGNRWGDTKAEENGWDQILISLAPNMFPNHPHAAQWREKSIEYMMNTVSVPQDLKDERIVDGRRVRNWVSTVNYHPDFTLENHGFFHPTYAMVSPAEVGQGAIFYKFAGNPIPEAAGHNLTNSWLMLQQIMLPSGYWAFPQGMDWALNSEGHIHYLAWLATYSKDPLAAAMERRLAQYISGHQQIHGGGNFAGPASRLGFAREAIVAERLAYSYFYHRLLGGMESDKTIADSPELLGVRRYNFVDVITHRTGSKFASFSWKNKIMGLVMPIADHLDEPCFTSPNTSSLVGSFAVEGNPGGLKVIERTWHKTADGFETEGKLQIGPLKQTIKFVSVGEKTVIYMDRVMTDSDVTIKQESGPYVTIENDEFTGDQRTLYFAGGSQVVKGADTEGLIRIPGNWANVDGRLGMVAPTDRGGLVKGSGLAYQDVKPYNRDGAREDYLFGSYSDKPQAFKAGEEVARRIVVLFTEVTPEETASLAGKIRLTGETLHVLLPEGGEYALPVD
jgi:hypothetical protein